MKTRMRNDVRIAIRLFIVVAALLTSCEKEPASVVRPTAAPAKPTAMAAPAKVPPQKVEVAVYGGAEGVAGSLAILDTGNGRWMIDCGAYYPDGEGDPNERDERAAQLNQSLPDGATSVDAVFITHAHLDHIGRLLKLVRDGYRGPIYVTSATASLAPIMLAMQARYDSARVRDWKWSLTTAGSGKAFAMHWAGCEWQEKIRRAGSRRCAWSQFQTDRGSENEPFVGYPCKTCGMLEAATVSSKFVELRYADRREVAPGVGVTFLDAGHIPGSASVLVEVALQPTARKVLFSGDLGNELSNLIAGPSAAPPVDAVFVECTYGAQCRADGIEQESRAFRVAVADVVRRKGVAWIPAFALDRSQQILNQIALAQRDGTIANDVPVVCPSPTAREVSALYRTASDDKLRWFRPTIEGSYFPFSPASLREQNLSLPNDESSSGLDGVSIPRPCVLITTSGMMDAAFSESLLPKLLGDESVGVFLVGWQDPMSPGGQLSSGQSQVTVNKQTFPVKAAIHKYGCFSRHGDAKDIDAWLHAQSKDARIVLVHGEHDSLDARQWDLIGKGWTNVVVARPDEVVVSIK